MKGFVSTQRQKCFTAHLTVVTVLPHVLLPVQRTDQSELMDRWMDGQNTSTDVLAVFQFVLYSSPQTLAFLLLAFQQERLGSLRRRPSCPDKQSSDWCTIVAHKHPGKSLMYSFLSFISLRFFSLFFLFPSSPPLFLTAWKTSWQEAVRWCALQLESYKHLIAQLKPNSKLKIIVFNNAYCYLQACQIMTCVPPVATVRPTGLF